jgi:hypothetical protein
VLPKKSVLSVEKILLIYENGKMKPVKTIPGMGGRR